MERESLGEPSQVVGVGVFCTVLSLRAIFSCYPLCMLLAEALICPQILPMLSSVVQGSFSVVQGIAFPSSQQIPWHFAVTCSFFCW